MIEINQHLSVDAMLTKQMLKYKIKQYGAGTLASHTALSIPVWVLKFGSLSMV